MSNPIDVAKLHYPSDGATVLCSNCSKSHIRRHGWAHKDYPLCKPCDDKISETVTKMLAEWEAERKQTKEEVKS